MKLSQIAAHFGVADSFSPLGNGHINDTYASSDGRYVLQKINTYVFQNAEGLMDNLEKVTAFLAEEIQKEEGDPERETLTFLPADNGKLFYEDGEDVWRMDLLIPETLTIEPRDASPEDLKGAGKGFGIFQRRLSGFPAESLLETIPDFHHTIKRTEALLKAVSENKSGRRALAEKEIDYMVSLIPQAGKVIEGLQNGSIPLCVTHNDTKINNVLFDVGSSEPVCVLDLDTVMPGSRLYDLGDALRSGANTAMEDEQDLNLVHFDTERALAFIEGYLSEVKDVLTEREKELLVYSGWLMTYECGIRFLTDYLDGDLYFKVNRESQNLDRTRVHIKLLKEIQEKEEYLKTEISKMF